MLQKVRFQTPSSVFVLLRRNDQFCFLHRTNTGWMDGFYSVPAGGVEKGETLREAACRELHEELGVSTRRDQLTLCHVLHCQTNGDTWTGYFFATLSWLGEASAQEIQKHSHYRWSTLEGIADQLVPYVKVALEGMLAGKSYSEYGWPIRPNMRGQ